VSSRGDIEESLSRIRVLYAEDLQDPFPYPGCDWIIGVGGEAFRDLIPDLDVYLAETAGLASWGRKLLTWSRDQMLAAKRSQETSFFERFPRYRSLEASITPENTPDLHKALAHNRQMRSELASLLGLLLSQESAW
jgi:hypothetical protein